MEEPARLVVRQNNGYIRTCLQVTAPQDQAGLLTGRPVEELPRMLGLLSPSHHLVSALTLDRLFQVDPTPAAASLRQALDLAHRFRHHLRKILFLATKRPALENGLKGGLADIPALFDQRNIIDRIMVHVLLSQEACAILCGRCDHPLTAAAGGLTRAPKPEQMRRLRDIAASCLDFASGLSRDLRKLIFENNRLPEWFTKAGPRPMPSVTYDAQQDQIILRDPDGAEKERFTSEEVFTKFDSNLEPYSYLPFAYLRTNGWSDALDTENNRAFAFTGPLARLAGPVELSPLAREEKQRLDEARQTINFDSPLAGYWSLAVELIDAAERLNNIPFEEQTDRPVRNTPGAYREEAFAALESPSGLICHHYRVDSRGLVEKARILDPAVVNNARKCAAAQKAVEADPELTTRAIKFRAEISLWPY